MGELNEDWGGYSTRLKRNMRDISTAVLQQMSADEGVLLPKQKEAVCEAFNKVSADKKRAVAMVMPTATGKMVIVARILSAIYSAHQRQKRAKKVLFVCDGIEGIQQALEKMLKFSLISAGAYYQAVKEYEQHVTVTTFHSWTAESFPIDPTTIDLLILDEAHMAISEARLSTLQLFEHAIWIAVTASPYYNDEQNVLRYFELGYRMSVREAIQHKLICSFRNILLRSEIAVDLDNLNDLSADYNQKLLSKALNTEGRNRIAAEYILFGTHFDTGKPIREHRGIISCVDRAHARDVADQVNALFESYFPGEAPKQGFIRSVDGFSKDRRDILNGHKTGQIQYLAFADLLIHNYDDPGISVCLNLRPSTSIVLSTQRGGRTTRLDRSRPGKIALIVDMLDEFNGETTEWPLFYGAAIGEIALIDDDVAQAALAEKYERESHLAGRLGSIPIELREHARNVDIRTITDQEVILSIFKESQKKSAPPRTEEDILFTEMRALARAPVNIVKAAIVALKTDWERHRASPDTQPAPPINFYNVRVESSRIVQAISTGDWEAFSSKYLKKRMARLQTDDDLGPNELAKITGMSPTTLRQILRNLLTEAQENNGERKQGSHAIPVELVRRAKSSPFLSISRSDLPKFLSETLNGKIFLNKSGNQVSVQELSEISGRSPQGVRTILKRLYEQPADQRVLKVSKVRDGCSMPTYAILRDEVTKFLNLYQHGKVIQEKRREDATVEDLMKQTGYSRNRLHDALLTLEKEWAAFNNQKANIAEPPVQLYFVHHNEHVMKAIPFASIDQFKAIYLRGKTVYAVGPDDLLPEELARNAGVIPATIRQLLRKLDKEQAVQSETTSNHHHEIPIHRVRVNGHHSLAIKRPALNNFLEQHFPHRAVRQKTFEFLTVDDICDITGYAYGIIGECFRKLTTQWDTYNKSPEKQKRPPVVCHRVRVPGKKSPKPERAIHRNDFQLFKEMYLSHKKLRVKTTMDLTVSEVANLLQVNRGSVALIFTKINSLRKSAIAFKAPAITTFEVYNVKIPGGPVRIAIHASQFMAFVQEYFSHLVQDHAIQESTDPTHPGFISFIRKRHQPEPYFTLKEIMEITGLSKYILDKYFKPLQKAWANHYKFPMKHQKPEIRVLQVASNNQSKAYAIPQIHLFQFLSQNVPLYVFKNKSLDAIYKAIKQRQQKVP